MSAFLKQTIRLVVRHGDMLLQSLTSDNFSTDKCAVLLNFTPKDIVAVLQFAKMRYEQERDI